MRGEPAQGGPDLIRNSAYVYEYVQKRAAYPMLVATSAVSDYILAMDRETLLNRLEAAKRRVAATETLVAHQKSVIDSLRSTGNDSSLAEETLTTLLITQEEYLAEVEETLDELDLIPLVD